MHGMFYCIEGCGSPHNTANASLTVSPRHLTHGVMCPRVSHSSATDGAHGGHDVSRAFPEFPAHAIGGGGVGDGGKFVGGESSLGGDASVANRPRVTVGRS